MRKILFISALLLFASYSFAQKVKIKKDLISINDVDVGHVYNYKDNATGDEGFIYTDLADKDSLFVIRRDYNEGRFYDVSASFNKNKSEIDYDALVFSLKDISIITNLIVQNYLFYTVEGLNKVRINKYLNGQRVTRQELMRRLREEPRSKVAQEFDNSKIGLDTDVSRTDINGILSFKDNKTLEGTFRVFFRQTEDGRVTEDKDKDKEKGFTINLNNPQSGVTYLYTDDKGRDRTKVYSPSSVVSLEVKRADGKEEIYDVINRNKIVSVITVQSDGSVNPKGTGTSASKEFALRIIETPTMTLHYKDGVYFVAKNGKDAMPVLEDQVKEQLLVLSEPCPEIMKKVDSDFYAGYTREKLIQFVRDYNGCANNPFK